MLLVFSYWCIMHMVLVSYLVFYWCIFLLLVFEVLIWFVYLLLMHDLLYAYIQFIPQQKSWFVICLLSVDAWFVICPLICYWCMACMVIMVSRVSLRVLGSRQLISSRWTVVIHIMTRCIRLGTELQLSRLKLRGNYAI